MPYIHWSLEFKQSFISILPVISDQTQRMCTIDLRSRSRAQVISVESVLPWPSMIAFNFTFRDSIQHRLQITDFYISNRRNRNQNKPFLLKFETEKPFQSYLNRVAHETRCHFRSGRFSRSLKIFQRKYHTKTALIPILIFSCSNMRVHVEKGRNSQLFYRKLCKQSRFPPFNESLNSPRNHNTEHQNEAGSRVRHYGSNWKMAALAQQRKVVFGEKSPFIRL